MSRWIPEKGRSGRVYFSGSWQVTDDWMLGMDVRPLAGELGLFSSYRLVSEDEEGWRPAVFLGTMKDQFEDGSREVVSRTLFTTVSKALPSWEGVTLSPYVGAAWIHELEEVRPLAGVNVGHEWASLLVQYSGTDWHVLLSRQVTEELRVGVLYWGLRYPGVTATVRF